jgi:glycosyltransferase involved in cell wall biosynthesis
MVVGGWDGDRTSLYGQRIMPGLQAKAVLDADIVVFHRPNDDRSFEIARMLKLQGKKIVMDNDDTYKGVETHKMALKLKKVDANLDKFVREMADMVTCSTEFLAEEYRKINPNVVVLKNCIDPDDWPEEPQRNESGKVRIGLVGSVGLNNDYKSLAPILEHLCARPDVQVVLFSVPPKNEDTKKIVQKLYRKEYQFWEQFPNIEWQPFVPVANYISTLDDLKLDLMLIPRSDDYFNRCKSNIKFLESSMLEVPVIAQGFEDGQSPYQQNPEDAKHMVIVTDNSKWLEEIDRLIANPELRRKIGKEAKEYVLENYDIHKNIHLWEEAYESLSKKNS